MDVPCWGADQILSRAADLTARFLEIWPRPVTPGIGGDGQLTPILDVPRRPGYYPGWATEYEYAVFRGETLEVRNVKELFLEVFKRLLAERREDVLAWRPRTFDTEAQHPQFALVAPGVYRNMAIFPQFHLKVIQLAVDEFDIADDLLIKFSADEADDDLIESFAEPRNEEESVPVG